MAIIFTDQRTIKRPRCLAFPALANAVFAEAASYQFLTLERSHFWFILLKAMNDIHILH